MQKVLLIGESGQLGSEIKEKLSGQKNIRLVSWSRLDWDLKFPELLEKKWHQQKYNWVILASALTNTAYCENNLDEAMAINGKSVGELARLCRITNTKLISFSTDYVFDGEQTRPYLETDKTNPLNIYGRSKLEGEQLLFLNNPQSFCFRVASLFGKYGTMEKKNSFLANILKRGANGETIQAVEDQWMSPTSTNAIANLIIEMINNDWKNYGLYHYTSSHSCSWYELAKFTLETAQIKCPLIKVSRTAFPAVIKRPVYSVLNSSKISAYFQSFHWQHEVEQMLIQLKKSGI